jgi:hypothetical protein
MLFPMCGSVRGYPTGSSESGGSRDADCVIVDFAVSQENGFQNQALHASYSECIPASPCWPTKKEGVMQWGSLLIDGQVFTPPHSDRDRTFYVCTDSHCYFHLAWNSYFPGPSFFIVGVLKPWGEDFRWEMRTYDEFFTSLILCLSLSMRFGASRSTGWNWGQLGCLVSYRQFAHARRNCSRGADERNRDGSQDPRNRNIKVWKNQKKWQSDEMDGIFLSLAELFVVDTRNHHRCVLPESRFDVNSPDGKM